MCFARARGGALRGIVDHYTPGECARLRVIQTLLVCA